MTSAKICRSSAVFRAGIALAIALLLLTPQVWAQGFLGTISGNVQDQTGLAIAGATVRLTNTATGDNRTLQTSPTGTYSFPNLLVSTYTLTVEQPGFKKHTRENVAVSANQVVEVNARLEIGILTQEVLVIGGADLVNVSTAQLQGITLRNPSDLPNPMLSGNPNNYAILAPGTTTMPGGMAGEGGSIGGNRPRNNNFVVDGLDNNDPSTTGQISPVISEAVEEFTLLTNQFSAEYGHSTAGQFITTTKSGTNSLHGRAWWYNQNRHFNSLDNLTRATTKAGAPKPRYDWNRFGGQAGGPIIKDKLFVFSSYEYRNQTLAGTAASQILVPTAAGLTTLQNLASTSGTGISPVTVGLITAHIPVAATATTSTTVTNELTNSQVSIPLGAFSATTPNFDRTHLFLGNSDFRTTRHQLSGRYSYSRNPFVVAGVLPVEKFNSNASYNTHRITFSHVFTVSSRIMNEFRAGYSRAADIRPVDLPAAPGATDIFGNYQVSDISMFIGPLSNYPQRGVDNVYQFSNSTSVVSGAHTMKFGAELRNIISTSDFLPRARGEFTYSSLDEFARDRFPGTIAIRGVGQGTFAQNRTAYYAFAQDSWKLHPRFNLELGLRYEFTTISRDQKLQNLNGISNVSLRDEVFSTEMGYAATDPRLGRRIFDTLTPNHQRALLFHVGDSLIFRQPNPDINNFAPRIGLTWDVTGDGKTSLRAGAAIAHDVYYGNLALLQLPPQAQAENRETNACVLSPAPRWCTVLPTPTTNPRTVSTITHSNVGFLAGGGLLPALPGATRINRLTARQLSGNYVFPDETSPETYNWSLSLQREQFKGWKFEGRYIGNHSVHLPIQIQKNAGVPNPVRMPVFMSLTQAQSAGLTAAPTLADYNSGLGRMLVPYGFTGALTSFIPDGQSWYHGGSISLEKQMSHGFSINTSYTFSKTLDLIENDLNTSALNPRRPKEMYDIFANKGLSGMHRAHKFVVSWMYNLPTYRGDVSAIGHILNNWQLNGMYIAESGQPTSIISLRDVNGDGDTAGDTAYFNASGQANVGSEADFVCRQAGVLSSATSATGCGGAANVVGYVSRNPNAMYVRGQAGMVSNLARNTHVMPGINTTNLALFKNIRVSEGNDLQLRIEMWNAFNHPSYTLGSGTIDGVTTAALTTSGYGTPGSPQFLNKAVLSGGLGNNPFQRIIQWGLRYNF